MARPTPRTSTMRGSRGRDLADGVAQRRPATTVARASTSLVGEDVQHGQAAAAADTGLPPNVLKNTVSSANALGDLAAGDDRPDRMAVAHRLAEGDDVGDDPEPLERPHRLARPAVPALDLVGDPQAAGGARRLRPTPPRAPASAGAKPSLVRTPSRMAAAERRAARRSRRASAASNAAPSRSRAAQSVGRRQRLDMRRAAGRAARSRARAAAIASEMPWYAKAGAQPAAAPGARSSPGARPGRSPRSPSSRRRPCRGRPGIVATRRSASSIGAVVQVAQVRVEPPGLAGDRLGHARDARGRRTGRCCRRRGSAGHRRRSSRRPGADASGSARS